MGENLKVQKGEEVAVQDTTPITKFDSFNSVDEMLNFADYMIKSKLVPANMKDPEKLVAIIVQGRELGFGAATSINTIHNIQGRVTLSVHAILALLKRRNVAYRIVEDMYAVRQDGTADKVKKYKNKTRKDESGNDIPVMTINPQTGDEVPVQEEAYVYNDMRTTVEFYEVWNGEVITHQMSFTWMEAVQQGLTDKDNWQRMPRIMMRTRALALGARLVAPDALLGMYETTEAADFSNTNVNITQDGAFAAAEVINQ